MDASNRRTIPEDAVLWQPEDGRGFGHRPQAGQTLDAFDGLGGDLSQAAIVATRSRTQNIPVFTAKYSDCQARPGVVQRHHLRADDAGLDVPDSGHGLVQPLRVVVAVVEHLGRTVLSGGLG